MPVGKSANRTQRLRDITRENCVPEGEKTETIALGNTWANLTQTEDPHEMRSERKAGVCNTSG